MDPSPAILLLVLRQGMVLLCAGVAIGMALSLMISHTFARMLFGLNPADPLSLAVASSALILVAALACYLPALAASKMDPMGAMRKG